MSKHFNMKFKNKKLCNKETLGKYILEYITRYKLYNTENDNTIHIYSLHDDLEILMNESNLHLKYDNQANSVSTFLEEIENSINKWKYSNYKIKFYNKSPNQVRTNNSDETFLNITIDIEFEKDDKIIVNNRGFVTKTLLLSSIISPIVTTFAIYKFSKK